MTQPRHTPKELDALRAFSVPTLFNAVETFGMIPPNAGFCHSTMKCHFPDLPLMLGYAVTARIAADQPPSMVRPPVPEPDYWRFVADQPGPRVIVVQDIDPQPRGAIWGEWNANIHKALGCVGTVTNGAVRDLDGVRKLNFHYFSTHILPGHGYAAFVKYGGSVRVAGLVVSTGDLLAGDQHGVILIPPEIPLRQLAEVAAEIDRLESEIFALCQSPDFSISGLVELERSVASRWPKPNENLSGWRSQ